MARTTIAPLRLFVTIDRLLGRAAWSLEYIIPLGKTSPQGLMPLRWHDGIARIAREHAEQMAELSTPAASYGQRCNMDVGEGGESPVAWQLGLRRV
jgi:hypothetical protein